MAATPTITTENVSYKGATLPILNAYLARPDGAGPFPAVVVIHEAYGLNDDIRSIAERFAGEGYTALAVDLFGNRNKVMCMFRFFGGMFTNSLDHEGIKNLRASLDYLSGLPYVDKNRVGAIGFCMGGSFSIAWACSDNRLKAIAPYYSFNPRPAEALARSCPVVGSFPGNDITKGQGEKLNIELERFEVPHDIKIYPGTGHSFFNTTMGSYNPEAAADSWQRVLTFFKAHMG